MKKNLFFAALAITALVSCSESDYLGDERPSPVSSSDEVAIGFGSGLRAITRADVTGAQAADSLGNNFVVFGVKSDGGPFNTANACDTVFDHYNVNWAENTANTTTSNTANWEYVAQTKHQYGPAGDQTIKYWDYAKKQYDFVAYSKGKDNAGLTVSEIDVKKLNGVKSGDVITDGAYQMTGTAEQLAKAYIADLVTVCRDNPTTLGGGHYGQEVDIKFRSLSAKVRIGLYEIVPGYSVKDVVFYTDASTAATDGEAHLYTTGSDKFNESGTYIVYFPTTGTTHSPDSTTMDPKSDYNKAHLKFIAGSNGTTTTDKAFGALTGSLTATGFAAPEKEEATGNYLGRTSNTATYAGNLSSNYYTVVIPNEDGTVLNLKVDYTLVSTDGDGETIHVTGATAQVPAVYAAWKSGYAYTYLFKISQNGNGFTNPDITDKAGLFPITFDAVVVNDEVDGIQETITTVAEPSITTYSKGKVVTENDEYLATSKIYVVVEDGAAPAALTADNAKLYTVTLQEGAAQTINEASVANALANGSPNSSDSPTSWTVTDANGKNMVVASADGLTPSTKIVADDSPDGNEIGVNCAYFTPSSNAADTIYVFQYIKTAPVPAAPVTYTAEEVKTYNAALTGALNSTDQLTADQATAYNAAISEANKAEGDTLSEDEAANYNATLPGAVTTSTVKTPVGGTTPGVYGYKIIRIQR